ncbi:MAG: hypothetical protein AB1610_02540 [Nitrospirota bacterium]
MLKQACPEEILNRDCPEQMLKQVQHDSFGIQNDTFRVQHDTSFNAFVSVNSNGWLKRKKGDKEKT